MILRLVAVAALTLTGFTPFLVRDAGAAPTRASERAPQHFRLDRSAPEADTEVASPSEIRLWFSQSAQEGATSIRLLDAEGELVATGAIEAFEADAVHAVPIDGTLPPGAYTVSWRSMASDGHVVRGDFGFTVHAADRGDRAVIGR